MHKAAGQGVRIKPKCLHRIAMPDIYNTGKASYKLSFVAPDIKKSEEIKPCRYLSTNSLKSCTFET